MVAPWQHSTKCLHRLSTANVCVDCYHGTGKCKVSFSVVITASIWVWPGRTRSTWCMRLLMCQLVGIANNSSSSRPWAEHQCQSWSVVLKEPTVAKFECNTLKAHQVCKGYKGPLKIPWLQSALYWRGACTEGHTLSRFTTELPELILECCSLTSITDPKDLLITMPWVHRTNQPPVMWPLCVCV